MHCQNSSNCTLEMGAFYHVRSIPPRGPSLKTASVSAGLSEAGSESNTWNVTTGRRSCPGGLRKAIPNSKPAGPHSTLPRNLSHPESRFPNSVRHAKVHPAVGWEQGWEQAWTISGPRATSLRSSIWKEWEIAMATCPRPSPGRAPKHTNKAIGMWCRAGRGN